MGKIIEFMKKYKIQLLILLVVIFFFRSCGKSTKVRRLEKSKVENIKTIDSLTKLVNKQKDSINIIPKLLSNERVKTHFMYDNWITEKNRGPQLMELHKFVKNNIEKEEK